MKPGYYVCYRDGELKAEAEKARFVRKFKKGDLLYIERDNRAQIFDWDDLEWVPLQWIRNADVVINDAVDYDFGRFAVGISADKVKEAILKKYHVDPDVPGDGPPLPRRRAAERIVAKYLGR